jgi:CxxC-x17-CxxC domain-containing protein
MKNFSRNRNERRGGGDRKERPNMHSAVCSACGKRCEVPFKPTGDKPIYCSSCFEEQGGSYSKRGDSYNRQDREVKKMFSAVCVDCGKRCEVPFRPTGNKPIYCSSCFENVGSTRSGGYKKSTEGKNTNVNADAILLNDQLKNINSKLEKIIEILSPTKKELVSKEKITTKKEKIEKPKKGKKKLVTKKETKETAPKKKVVLKKKK